MNLKKITEGAGHEVFEDLENPNTLIKKPKPRHLRSFPLDRVRADLELAHKHFGQWLPETSILEDGSHSYYIRQERISDARHIDQALLTKMQIRAEVESILIHNRAALEQNKCGLDFLGLEGSAKCVLSHAERFRGSIIEKIMIAPALRAAETFGKHSPIPIPSDASKWWERRETKPEISNLLHGKTAGREGVFITDLSLVRIQGQGVREWVRSKVLQKWNRHFLKKYFGLTM